MMILMLALALPGSAIVVPVQPHTTVTQGPVTVVFSCVTTSQMWVTVRGVQVAKLIVVDGRGRTVESGPADEIRFPAGFDQPVELRILPRR